MVENSVNISTENTSKDSFSISLDGIQVPLTNVVYSNVDFKKDTKIEIFYTRSYRDYFRSVLFFFIRLLIIGLIIFGLFYYISLYIKIPSYTAPSSYNYQQILSDSNNFFTNIENSI